MKRFNLILLLFIVSHSSSFLCRYEYRATPSRNFNKRTKKVLVWSISEDKEQMLENRVKNISGVRIREAVKNDLEDASKVLTQSFYSTNILTYPFEYLKTLLSLQDLYAEQKKDHKMYVAYDMLTYDVIGFGEVDFREGDGIESPTGPYMYNIAVSTKWRRKGVATALVETCERQVMDSCSAKSIFLKVKPSNKGAVDLYARMGYVVKREYKPSIAYDGEDVIVLGKELPSKLS